MQKINWGLSKKKTLGGFTLIEVLVVVFVLSMGVLVIMQGINKTTTYISETAQRTIALNLAKEGLEAMYNIRNTNWRRRSDSRDKCWLKANPMVDEGNLGCEDDEWIREWRYVTFLTGEAWKKYHGVYAREPYTSLLPNHFPRFKNWTQKWGLLVQDDIDFSRQYDDVLGFTSYGPKSTSIVYHDGNFISSDEYLNLSPIEKQKVSKKLGEYRRLIAIVGLYPKSWDKDDISLLQCFSWNTWDCGNSTPKELRFCSVVRYTQPYEGVVQVCSIMTNFLK
mgnify:FL=1